MPPFPFLSLSNTLSFGLWSGRVLHCYTFVILLSLYLNCQEFCLSSIFFYLGAFLIFWVFSTQSENTLLSCESSLLFLCYFLLFILFLLFIQLLEIMGVGLHLSVKDTGVWKVFLLFWIGFFVLPESSDSDGWRCRLNEYIESGRQDSAQCTSSFTSTHRNYTHKSFTLCPNMPRRKCC
jgi:hypothetical protein